MSTQKLKFFCLNNGLNNDCGEQGEELKKMIGAITYIECSSKTQQVNASTSLDPTFLRHILRQSQALD